MRIFRAWINEYGSNEDRQHEKCGNCQHIRLRDLETDSFRIVARLLTRRRPFLFEVLVFQRDKGWTVLRVGRKPAWR